MAQFSAIMHSFGIRYGYYEPNNWRMAMYCDPIIDIFGDIMYNIGQYAFINDPDQKPALLVVYAEHVKKFTALCEKNLEHHKGKFIAGDKVTIADFVMASYIGNYVMNPNSPLTPAGKAAAEGKPYFNEYIKTVISTFTHL